MSLIKSAFTVSFFISLSRIFGFIRDILIAHFLGVSILSDVFFAAFRLPNFFRRIFGEGAFNSAFVPIYIEKIHDQQEKNEDKLFVQNVFSILLYALLVFTLIFQIFMPFFMKIIFPGFLQNAEKFSLLVDLSRITIFYLFFISLVSLCSSILNSMSRFAVPASSPIILNISLIFSFFIFGDIVPNYAYALSWGVFLAGILQFSYLMYFTFRQKVILYPKYFKLSLFTNKDIKKFFKKLLPGVIGANVMQINLLVDSIFASLIFGALSFLYYADRVNQLPLAMIGIAIGIALLPEMSRKIRLKDKDSAIKLQNLAIEIALILVVPAFLALSILSYEIISVLFERGEFGQSESRAVSRALKFYALGLPAYVLVKVLEPAFFARLDTKTPMLIAIICMIANIIFNSSFYFAGLGYIGIVFSSVLSSYLNLTIIFCILIKRKNFYFVCGFLRKFLRIIYSSILMALFLFFARRYFAASDDFSIRLELMLMVIFGGLFYLISSYFFGSLKVILQSNFLKKNKLKI